MRWRIAPIRRKRIRRNNVAMQNDFLNAIERMQRQHGIRAQ